MEGSKDRTYFRRHSMALFRARSFLGRASFEIKSLSIICTKRKLCYCLQLTVLVFLLSFLSIASCQLQQPVKFSIFELGQRDIALLEEFGRRKITFFYPFEVLNLKLNSQKMKRVTYSYLFWKLDSSRTRKMKGLNTQSFYDYRYERYMIPKSTTAFS